MHAPFHLQSHVEGVKNTRKLHSGVMAGPSNRTIIQSNGSELDVIEVFRTAISSILHGEGLTVPTEDPKFCLKILNLRGIAKVN